MHPSLVAALVVTGLFTLMTASGCAAEPTEEESAESGEDALTVDNGDAYIVSVDADTVTLRKQVRGVSLRFAASDFANKSVLIHPIPKKTETGVYAHVESVDDEGNTLVLHTRGLELEEMEQTKGTDVIRLYRNKSLSVAPTSPQSAGLDGAGALMVPVDTATQGGGVRPLTLTGPLATGELPTETWVGTRHNYGTAQITSSVESVSLDFKPAAMLDYTRGRGLTVGIRGDFTADLAVKAKGHIERRVVFFETPTLKSPRVTFAVPIGIPPLVVPVPVVMGVNTFVECSTLGAVEFDGVFRAHLGLNASASAVISPGLRKPLNQWVAKGPWENTVGANMSFTNAPGTTVSGKTGIACALPRVEFPITVAGLVGPFLAIQPEFSMTTSGPHNAVELYAGATSELVHEALFQTLLLRWEPGHGGGHE
jgi:hypothetical protein